MNSNRFTIFRSLTLLRQLSLHAGLVDQAHASLASAKIDVLLDKLHEVTSALAPVPALHVARNGLRAAS